MNARLSNLALKDQCRCGPRKDDTPAPNETRSTVAQQTNLCKSFCKNGKTREGKPCL
jgi:hypothetical protein